jgi:hypothetical protein
MSLFGTAAAGNASNMSHDFLAQILGPELHSVNPLLVRHRPSLGTW